MTSTMIDTTVQQDVRALAHRFIEDVINAESEPR